MVSLFACDKINVEAHFIKTKANKIAQRGRVTFILNCCQAEGVFHNFFRGHKIGVSHPEGWSFLVQPKTMNLVNTS